MSWELLALLALSGLLALHALFFRRPAASSLGLTIQRGGRYPFLALCFLLPTAWLEHVKGGSELATNLLQAGFFVACASFAFEILFELAARTRRGRARRRVLRVVAYTSVLGLIGLHTLGRLDDQGDMANAILACGAVFVALMIAYDAVFKWPRGRSPLWRAFWERLRGLAQVAVPTLTLYYLLSAWRIVPVTRTQVLGVQQLVVALALAALGEAALFLLLEVVLPARGRAVPQLFRQAARSLLYLALAWRSIHGIKTGSVALGSAFASVSLGLALKPTLGNLVSGLALRLARPFDLGDYLEVQGIMGKVQAIDWRSSVLLTLTGDLVSFPNSVLAKAILLNHSLPSPVHASYLDFKITQQVSPARLRQMVAEALENLPMVLAQPASEVYMMEFAENGLVKYRVRYWIGDPADIPVVDSALHAQLIYTLRRYDLSPQLPGLNAYTHKGEARGTATGSAAASSPTKPGVPE